MNSSVEIVKDFKVPSIVPLNAEHWKIVGQIVKRNVQEGIKQQVMVTGKAYPRLKPNTVASKEAKGSPEPKKRLMDTLNLLENQTLTVVKNGIDIGIGPTRREIASWMQEGTVPHTIVPKNASVLVFTVAGGRSLGAVVGRTKSGKAVRKVQGKTYATAYAKSVKHPGTEPVAFFGISQKCAQEVFKYVASVYEQQIDKVK